MQKACFIRTASIIIGGNFNFQGWDWTCNALKPGSAFQTILIRLSNISAEPTRKATTLDPLLTNRGEQALRVDILPGISDNDIVFAEMDSKPDKHQHTPRLIPLYKKANWGKIKGDTKVLNESTASLYSSNTTEVNAMCEHFKDTLHTSLKSHILVPHRRVR